MGSNLVSLASKDGILCYELELLFLMLLPTTSTTAEPHAQMSQYATNLFLLILPGHANEYGLLNEGRTGELRISVTTTFKKTHYLLLSWT